MRRSSSAGMSGASNATVTDFSDDPAHVGRYYLTITPPVGTTTYCRVDYLGGSSGFEGSVGTPVLHVSVSGNTALTTWSRTTVVAYNGLTTVLGTLTMASVAQPGAKVTASRCSS